MRSLLWPILLLGVLGLLMGSVLPVWLPGAYVPNLLLVGLLVLACTDGDFSWFWLAAFSGLFLDIQSNLLVGSFTVGLSILYVGVREVFKRFVPSERVYFALPVAYLLCSMLLLLWIFICGLLAAQLGWQIQPIFVAHAALPWFVAIVVGSIVSIVVYILWLEVLHRFDRPLRFRRRAQLK